ncbi:hypothetical protein R2083_10995 [Nitrosomonas sp. Is35]|uniref:hypothetical protein n=1 Tax=Nitrosomonas sp. Is35 TaxID=3080534 RepID=UPI00294B2EFE|nr:hypothetical protein [Nitrosomonas sp. Is35]MDV6348040.1 hypothetical protein [Nitrosomonas sp. Is35]
MKASLLHYLLILLMIPMLSGCWLLAAGGAGAYGGYKAKEAGYGVQNPVTKDKKTEDQKK